MQGRSRKATEQCHCSHRKRKHTRSGSYSLPDEISHECREINAKTLTEVAVVCDTRVGASGRSVVRTRAAVRRVT